MVTTKERARLRMCYCTAFGCKGKLVSTSELQMHKARSEEIAQDAILKEVERDIIKLTLLDAPATPRPSPVDNKHSPQSLHSSASPSPSSSSVCHAEKIPSQIDQEEGAFRVLYNFDRQIENRYNEITSVLAQWDSNGVPLRSMEVRFSTRQEAAAFLRKESGWFSDLGSRLKCTPTRGDDVNRHFIKVMVERTTQITGEIQKRLSEWGEIEARKAQADDYYNNGK